MQQTSLGRLSCGIHHEPGANGATTRQPSNDGEDKAPFSRSAVLTFGQRPSTLRTGDLLEVEFEPRDFVPIRKPWQSGGPPHITRP